MAAKPGHRSSIAALAACTVLLGLSRSWLIGHESSGSTRVCPAWTNSSSASRTKANRSSIPDKKGQIAARPPALVNPANGATFPNPNPPTGIVLHWQPVANASRLLGPRRGSNRTKPVVDERDLNRTSLRIEAPSPRACARLVTAGAGGSGRWSTDNGPIGARPARSICGTGGPGCRGAHAGRKNPQVQPEPAEPEKAAEPAGPEEIRRARKPIVRPPLPSEAARKKANQVFRDVYAKQYAAPKTAEGQSAWPTGGEKVPGRGKGASDRIWVICDREGKRCQRPNLGNMR